jgi:hypothetical protein
VTASGWSSAATSGPDQIAENSEVVAHAAAVLRNVCLDLADQAGASNHGNVVDLT